jgi:hypothetical protein
MATLHFAQGGKAGNRKLLVFACGLCFPLKLALFKLTDYTRRNASYKASRGHLPTDFHKCAGSYDRGLPDNSVVHDDSIHANQGVASQDSTVNHCPVPDMGRWRKLASTSMSDMQRAVILHVAPLPDNNRTEVTPDGSERADVAARPYPDVTNDRRQRMNKRCGINIRYVSLKFVDRHAAP